MSERPRGRDPGQPLQEREYILYHRAARYADAATSKDPYDKTQDLIHDNPCNLSVYRMRLGEGLQWHVAVVGTPPPEELERRIVENLATGEAVTLADWVVERLIKRREETTREGQYVEKHHYPRRRIR